MIARVHGDAYASPGLADFAVNVWPQARPPALAAALARALEGRGYPDEAPARAAVAARHGRDPAEVLLLNGACEAFWLLAHALRPRHAACVHPAFTEPDAALRAAGAQVSIVAREPERWTFDPGDVPDGAQVVVVGNPNNPTGTLAPRAGLLALRRPGRLVVVDESFMDFVPGAAAASLAGDALEDLVVVRSLTKAWSLAGVRAGYLLGPAPLVARLAAQRQPWSVNAIACAAIAACAEDGDTPRRLARAAAASREWMRERLGALPGVRVWPSAANFLLLELPRGAEIVAALRRAGIAVRPAASFPGLTEDHVRVAVRPDGDLLVEALEAVLAA